MIDFKSKKYRKKEVGVCLPIVVGVVIIVFPEFPKIRAFFEFLDVEKTNSWISQNFEFFFNTLM